MKLQDRVFIAIFSLFIVAPNKIVWVAGMVTCILAGILFLGGNLFTAQRLSMYAAGFLFLYCLKEYIKLLIKRHENYSEKISEKSSENS
jgi:hypothetical protein